jgi:indolepyruvate ferredoxin oxidoreductase beta subunit
MHSNYRQAQKRTKSKGAKMRNDIILAGVGGQGILSIAASIGYAALDSGLSLKQSEVHGMSQRGGDVSSHLRISDKEIFSDLIPQGSANMIISVEPMESLRYIPWLAPDGWLITNTVPFINIANYPDVKNIMNEKEGFKNHIAINADEIARKLGSARSANMVMLGAASPFIDIPYEKFEKGIKDLFGRKGDDIVNLNMKALKAGREFTETHKGL